MICLYFMPNVCNMGLRTVGCLIYIPPLIIFSIFSTRSILIPPSRLLIIVGGIQSGQTSWGNVLVLAFTGYLGVTVVFKWNGALQEKFNFCFRKIVYAMFKSNNRTSFHWWWKENLEKHQKVSKYYETRQTIWNNILDLTFLLSRERSVPSVVCFIL